LILGLSDGLTVPFALAAGLSGAITSLRIVVSAGLAEIAAGGVAMGLGGFLAARSEAEHYAGERERERREVESVPAAEEEEVRQALARFGLGREIIESFVQDLRRSPEAWVEFMMKMELGLAAPESRAPWKSAFTIGGAYVAGGLLPLIPYMTLSGMLPALALSSVITLVSLSLLGAIRGFLLGSRPLRSAAETVAIGGLAALAAFLLTRSVAA
jgi:VIT1/CCC1 family predicted Fe2+/Mn2+ transporter